MPATMLHLLMKTGKEFRWQGGVSNAMTQTESGGLESASTLFTTQQVKLYTTNTHTPDSLFKYLSLENICSKLTA